MEMPDNTANPQTIARCERLIRPHIRRTPVIEVNGDDGADWFTAFGA